MPSIDIKAVAIAFTAEIAADFLIGSMLLAYFGRGLFTPEMSDEEVVKVGKVVYETTAFVPWAMVCGTATTIGGAWLAARIARRIPYYHGLAMGILGILFTLMFWRPDATGSYYLGLLLSIPASLYGAHLAKAAEP